MDSSEVIELITYAPEELLNPEILAKFRKVQGHRWLQKHLLIAVRSLFEAQTDTPKRLEGHLDYEMTGWFTWSDTPQGHKFWQKLYEAVSGNRDLSAEIVKAITELPEIPPGDIEWPSY